MKIIAVDDEFGSLSVFLGAIVEDSDIDCRFFSGGVDAILNYCRGNEVKAAFLDINMPDVSGIDLAKKLIEMKPGIRIAFVTGTAVTMASLPDEVRENTLGVIYKPVSRLELKKCLAQIEERQSWLDVRMFDGFDCFLEGELVNFTSSKAKELFALLIVMKGKSLSMNLAISYLWPEKDLERAKKLYRDAVWRLRATLSSIRFECVVFSRAALSLDVSRIHCDYYDFLDGKQTLFPGYFLPSYDWSMDYQTEIDYLLEKRKRS